MGLTPEFFHKETLESLSSGLSLIPLLLTFKLPRQVDNQLGSKESAKAYPELSRLPEKETA